MALDQTSRQTYGTVSGQPGKGKYSTDPGSEETSSGATEHVMDLILESIAQVQLLGGIDLLMDSMMGKPPCIPGSFACSLSCISCADLVVQPISLIKTFSNPPWRLLSSLLIFRASHSPHVREHEIQPRPLWCSHCRLVTGQTCPAFLLVDAVPLRSFASRRWELGHYYTKDNQDCIYGRIHLDVGCK